MPEAVQNWTTKVIRDEEFKVGARRLEVLSVPGCPRLLSMYGVAVGYKRDSR